MTQQTVCILDNPELLFPTFPKSVAGRRKKIMREYLTLMQDALLAGNQWTLPGNFGSFRVEKKDQVRVPVCRVPKKGKLEKVLHLNRIGFSYQLVFIPGPGHSMKDYHFETAVSFRKLLNRILTDTQKDYPFYDKH